MIQIFEPFLGHVRTISRKINRNPETTKNLNKTHNFHIFIVFQGIIYEFCLLTYDECMSERGESL